MVVEIVAGAVLALAIVLLWYEINIIPYLFLGGLAFFLIKFTGGRIPKASFLENKKTDIPASGIEFAEIGGQEVAKKELSEALDFIKEPGYMKKMGIRPLKGILLVGPPGTGKTLLAKAAATYTGSAFLSAVGSEFIEMYAGVGAQRIRQLFNQCREQAKKYKKKNAVLFIDEIEILGGKRGSHTSHLEYDQTLNQFLVEMDGIERNKDGIHILVIGATNRSELLDPALLRPGRMDRIVLVELPDLEGRLEILKLHTRNKPVGDDVDLENVAKDAYGFSGAQLESLANEAAILAMRESKEIIAYGHFMEAIDKVMMGEKNGRRPEKEEIRRIAIHECGHALISEITRPGSVSVVTITPRGKALGYIRQHPENEIRLYTRDYLERQICVLLGGAISEKIMLGNMSTGSLNDFDQAVEVARNIVASGLSPLGVVSLKELPAKMLHQTLRNIIKGQEKKVKRIIVSSKSLLSEATAILMEKEKISGAYFRKNFNKNSKMAG